MKVLFSFILIGLQILVFAQDTVQFGGFIKYDMFYDTRDVLGGRENLFALYPAPEVLDANGKDIHAMPSFNFLAITSRLYTKVEKSNVWGAKAKGYIEADFSGMTNADINGLRLRHAYIDMEWTNRKLRMGLFWHPLFVEEVYPKVVSLNLGCPFQPFNRSTQIRYTEKLGKISLMAVFLSQRDYANTGPLGTTSDYMRNAIIPNMHAQIRYKNGNLLTGLAFDYKILQPRLQTDSIIKTTEKVQSQSIMGFLKYTKGKFTVRAKSIIGQNLSEHSIIGGYAVTGIDTATDIREYTPFTHWYAWTDFMYGKTFYGGLFAGYVKNLGVQNNDNYSGSYGRGLNLGYVYRIAPRIGYRANRFMINGEIEYTVAGYGQNTNNGTVANIKDITNTRFLIMILYLF